MYKLLVSKVFYTMMLALFITSSAINISMFSGPTMPPPIDDDMHAVTK